MQTRHQQIIAMYTETDTPPQEICTQFNISRQRLHQHRKRAGIKSRADSRRNRIIKHIPTCHSVAEVAKAANVSTDAVQLYLKGREDYGDILARFAGYREQQREQQEAADFETVRQQLLALSETLGRTPSCKEALAKGIAVRRYLPYAALCTKAGLTPNWKAPA